MFTGLLDSFEQKKKMKYFFAALETKGSNDCNEQIKKTDCQKNNFTFCLRKGKDKKREPVFEARYLPYLCFTRIAAF